MRNITLKTIDGEGKLLNESQLSLSEGDILIQTINTKKVELDEAQKLHDFIVDALHKKGDFMAKYRKKPVVIEAIQFNGRNSADIHEFCGDKVREPVGKDYLEIETLEGVHIASPGDYIIKGIKGEFYPCKPDIFELTYEKVEEDYAEQTYNIELHEFIQSYIDDNLEYMDTGKISDGTPSRNFIIIE